MAAGMTQAALAARAGTSQANVAKYEAGRMSPSVSTLERLLHAAGFSLHVAAVPVQALTDLSGARARKVRANRQAILDIVRRHGGSNVRLFGSVARGEDAEDSDIDLLIDFDTSEGLLPVVGMQQELQDLLQERVDVAPAALLKPEVAAVALIDAVPI